jgi:hypothetical protein
MGAMSINREIFESTIINPLEIIIEDDKIKIKKKETKPNSSNSSSQYLDSKIKDQSTDTISNNSTKEKKPTSYIQKIAINYIIKPLAIIGLASFALLYDTSYATGKEELRAGRWSWKLDRCIASKYLCGRKSLKKAKATCRLIQDNLIKFHVTVPLCKTSGSYKATKKK